MDRLKDKSVSYSIMSFLPIQRYHQQITKTTFAVGAVNVRGSAPGALIEGPGPGHIREGAVGGGIPSTQP